MLIFHPDDHFLVNLFVFIMLSLKGSLYFLDINPFWSMTFTNNLPQSVAFFILLAVPFKEQYVLIFMRSKLLALSFVTVLFWWFKEKFWNSLSPCCLAPTNCFFFSCLSFSCNQTKYHETQMQLVCLLLDHLWPLKSLRGGKKHIHFFFSALFSYPLCISKLDKDILPHIETII